jgi:hypothetical protein
MFKPTHQALAVTAATSGAIAMNAPLTGALAIVLIARQCAMIPDKMEKLFRVKMANHRTWTHWLVTCVAAGIALGFIVYGLGYLVEYLMRPRLTGPHAHDLIRSVHVASIGAGVLVGVGATIGAVMHSLADACTIGGVPLLGPFYTKKIWLMPDGLRIGVGQKVQDQFGNTIKTRELTIGEKRWFLLAHATTMFILFLHFAPYMHLDKIQS